MGRKQKKIPKPHVETKIDGEKKQGELPLYITAIFIDIEDSTGIANHYTSIEYKEFLSQYHDIVKKVLDNKEWDHIKDPVYHNFFGDEFMAFLDHDVDTYYKYSVSKALELATKIKLAWYFSKENIERLMTDKEVIEINVGVNFGEVHRMDYPFSSEGSRKETIEGFPITVAKRAQAVCDRARASRIILADAAYRQYVKETGNPHEFDYLGRQPLKGLAQSISCYEWLGGPYDTYMDFFPESSEEIQRVLKLLYDKNPLNPWYATLLAYYHYAIAERVWRDSGPEASRPYYNDVAKVCFKAIHSIPWSKLRQLSSLLLVCLEVQGNSWNELRFRAQQAFNADPTFAQAAALHAWAIFWLGFEDNNDKINIPRAAEEAQRTITLFERESEGDQIGDEIEEALYRSYLILAHYNYFNEKRYAQEKLDFAINHAIKGELDWTEKELITLKEKGAFPGIKASDWDSSINRLASAFNK